MVVVLTIDAPALGAVMKTVGEVTSICANVITVTGEDCAEIFPEMSYAAIV